MGNHTPLHWGKEELEEKPKNNLDKKKKPPFLVKLAIGLVILSVIYNIVQKEFICAAVDLIFGLFAIILTYRVYEILEKTKNLPKKERVRAMYGEVIIATIFLLAWRLIHYLLQ